MGLFDFITFEDFRSSLEADYQEMTACLKAGAWKDTHVLAGSIIETVLIDYLVTENHVDKSAALKLDFAKALSLCVEKKIITAKTNDLCSVIKEYRNLIHPGRIIRLKETITQDSAQVAKSLVHIILEEVAVQKRKRYGYTAEQIAAKIERDSSAEAIIPLLLKDANPIEIERLLLKILPDLYIKSFEQDFTAPHIRPAFIRCYSDAFRLATDDLKKKVTENFVRILKEEDERIVFACGKAFFRAEHLKYIQEKDISLVKRHLLARLKDDADGELLDTLLGIGAFLRTNEIVSFTDPLIKLVAYHTDHDVEDKARETIKTEYYLASEEVGKKLIERLNAWIDLFTKKNKNNLADMICAIKSDLEQEVPF